LTLLEARASHLLAAEAAIPLDSGHAQDGRSMNRSQIEKISKALADETRLRIFEAISHSGHMNCGEIVSMRGVTPATVSHHLKILSEAGLISCRRKAQFVYSEAVPETIEQFARALERLARGKKFGRR
jgi:ArsR family transcriptional regulator, arsenate/arsenite/antimonite-responsive transcriptional repressor